ncbi:flippase-like domain-containing protein [Candidatus Bipolaricaulota bacterium]|nr:flippase-like domain-containing protein [Candidatus Bipolaricaulota bacterium]
MKAYKVLLPLGLIGVGVALLGGLIYISGPRLVFQEIKAVGAWGFVAVVANVLCSLLAWLVSWVILLHAAGIHPGWGSASTALVAGYAISYLTPSMYLGGEPVRAYLVAKKTGVPMAQVMATVVVERLLAGLAILIFASLGGFFALVSPNLPLADKRTLGIALGIMAVFLFLAIFSFARNYHWISRLIRLLARLLPGRGRLLEAAAKVAETEQEIYYAFTRRLGFTSLAFLFQILTVFFNYLRPQVFFYFTQKTLFTATQLSLYFTLNAFLTAFLWITPGGMGVAEGGRMGIFSLLGIRPSGALAFSVLYRFAELVFVGGGIYLMLHRGLVRLGKGRMEMKAENGVSHDV